MCLRAVVRARLLKLGLGGLYEVVVEAGVPVEHVGEALQGELQQEGRVYADYVGGPPCSDCDSRLHRAEGRK